MAKINQGGSPVDIPHSSVSRCDVLIPISLYKRLYGDVSDIPIVDQENIEFSDGILIIDFSTRLDGTKVRLEIDVNGKPRWEVVKIWINGGEFAFKRQ